MKPRPARRVRVEIDVRVTGSVTVEMDGRLARVLEKRIGAGRAVSVGELELGAAIDWERLADADGGGIVDGLEVLEPL